MPHQGKDSVEEDIVVTQVRTRARLRSDQPRTAESKFQASAAEIAFQAKLRPPTKSFENVSYSSTEENGLEARLLENLMWQSDQPRIGRMTRAAESKFQASAAEIAFQAKLRPPTKSFEQVSYSSTEENGLEAKQIAIISSSASDGAGKSVTFSRVETFQETDSVTVTWPKGAVQGPFKEIQKGKAQSGKSVDDLDVASTDSSENIVEIVSFKHIRDLSSLELVWPWAKCFCALDRDGLKCSELIEILTNEARNLAEKCPTTTRFERDVSHSMQNRVRTFGTGRPDWGNRMVENLIGFAIGYQERHPSKRAEDLAGLDEVNGALYYGLCEVASDDGGISPALAWFRKQGRLDYSARVVNKLLFAQVAWRVVLAKAWRNDRQLAEFARNLRVILLDSTLDRADWNEINYPTLLRDLPNHPDVRFSF